MPNQVIIAAAGGGKTTRLAAMAHARGPARSAIVTFTNNSVRVVEDRLLEARAAVPTHIEVWSWYRYLLHELARPYQRTLLPRRIEGLAWVEGRSVPYVPRRDVVPFFLNRDGRIYSDKLARFVVEANAETGGAVVARLALRFTTIFIDEVQDMAGYDLELLDLLLKSPIEIVLVGDHRQATYRTNNASKNKRFAGSAIIQKVWEWEEAGAAEVKYECETHRCNQSIANLADALYPDEPRTVSLNAATTGHDGVFLLGSSRVADYVAAFNPQVLRYDRRTQCDALPALNFGESKGMTFDRVLIFPNKGCRKWIETGAREHVDGSAAKLYVAITRARHSVAFVLDGESALKGITRYA